MIVVTIPAYNEERTIGEVINNIKKVLKGKYKILVVDDGSQDNTAEVAKKAGAVVKKHPNNYGLAETFRTEMEEALKLKPDIIVHTDADMQYKAEEIPKLIEEVKKGNDLVLGSRFLGTIEHMPFIKRLGNIAFSKVISGITRTRIKDCQTGFRAFTKDVAKIPIQSSHTYTQEQIIKAVRQKFKIKEVPIYFAKRKDGKSRLLRNPFEYAAKAFLNLIRIYRDFEPVKFFTRIGVSMIALGVIVGLRVLYFFFTTGRVGKIPSTVLSALLIVVGIQVTIFGFLADMIKKN